jgi:hypothetical protein
MIRRSRLHKQINPTIFEYGSCRSAFLIRFRQTFPLGFASRRIDDRVERAAT